MKLSKKPETLLDGYCDNILNSTAPITPKMLFDAFNIHQHKQNTDKLKLLLEKAFDQNIDVNIQDDCGGTLLDSACFIEDINLVQFLLEQGTNPNISDDSSGTSLHLITQSALIRETKINIIKLLLQHGASTESKNFIGNTPIKIATKQGHTEIVKLLIEYGASIPDDSCYRSKSLIESVPEGKPELKALLTLAKACKNNDFGILDDSVTTENIKEFMDWRISIMPQNSKFISKHSSELNNLKNFLETKLEFVNDGSVQKLNYIIDFYSTFKNSLKKSLMFKIVENPSLLYNEQERDELPAGLIEEFEKLGIDLVGEEPISLF